MEPSLKLAPRPWHGHLTRGHAIMGSPRLGAVLAFVAWIAPASRTGAQAYQADVLYSLTAPAGLTDEFLDRLFGHEVFAAGGRTISYSLTPFGDNHAVMWDAAGTPIDLQPIAGAAFNQSRAIGGFGPQQFGSGYSNFLGAERAVVWNGSAASAENWHPTNITTFHSRIRASDGVQYVGTMAPVTGEERALLYNGSPSAAVNLHPASLPYVTQSRAWTVAAGKQGGDALTSTGVSHAMMWSGTAASVIDMHPPKFYGSAIFGMSSNQQVGIGQFDDLKSHALLWTGTAASAVDLHPQALGEFAESRAVATNGAVQVGGGLTTSEIAHAIMWRGNAASAVDLHALLPESYFMSAATAVDAAGVIYGLAASDDDVVHAVRWQPPAPSSPADFDGDGDVDRNDLTAWRIGYGTSTGASPSQGDANADGRVDGGDLLAWQRAVTAPGSQSASAAVPEPGAATIMLIVTLALGSRVKRLLR